MSAKIKKIFYNKTMREVIKENPVSIDDIVNAARKLNIPYVYNENSYTSFSNIKNILSEIKEKNDKKSNFNNPNHFSQKNRKEIKSFKKKENILIIDYVFAYNILNPNFEKSIVKIVKNLKITYIDFILDDDILKDLSHNNTIKSLVEKLKDINVQGEVKEVSRKNVSGSRTQRADHIISSKIGRYSALKKSIYFLSGDGDFIPVLENEKNSKITLLYYPEGESYSTKYNYDLKNLHLKCTHINQIILDNQMKERNQFTSTRGFKF